MKPATMEEVERIRRDYPPGTIDGDLHVLLARIAAIEAALKPFAELSGVYVRRAETFGWKDTDVVFGAADITAERNITVGDCRAALKALG